MVAFARCRFGTLILMVAQEVCAINIEVEENTRQATGFLALDERKHSLGPHWLGGKNTRNNRKHNKHKRTIKENTSNNQMTTMQNDDTNYGDALANDIKETRMPQGGNDDGSIPPEARNARANPTRMKTPQGGDGDGSINPDLGSLADPKRAKTPVDADGDGSCCLT
ncbi:unnamed protein product [Amoebophrya sp. A25]|nr:unnamed protein product [Amoebophrya sp. A25]|eukprot:GSA25T00023541001.1